jgi:hypothetical protein
MAEQDTDQDGTADCADDCPADPRKTRPGVCGCDRLDPADARAGALYCAKPQLLHRYAFNSDGSAATVAWDSVGDAHGAIYGGALARLENGALSLGGDQAAGYYYATEAHVSLPLAAIAGLRSATFECWVTWDGKGPVGEAAWQRIFDFGDANGERAHTYLYLTPEGRGAVRTAFSINGNGAQDEVSVLGAAPLPQHEIVHVAVVVDDAASRLSLYVNGAKQGETAMTAKLTDLTLSELWLGRSHFYADPAFFGSIHEFRIYGVALSQAQLQASIMVGPDYVFVP